MREIRQFGVQRGHVVGVSVAMAASVGSGPMDWAALYLDLMKRVLTRSGFRDGWIDSWSREVRDLRADNWVRFVLVPTQRLLARRGYRLVEAKIALDAEVIREKDATFPPRPRR